MTPLKPCLTACAALALVATAAVAHPDRDPPRERKTILYVTRHMNDVNLFVDVLDTKGKATGVQHDTCLADRSCCVQVLNPLGIERSLRLADWFDEHHITEKIEVALATFKPRTVATIQQIATNAGVAVQQIPAGQIECDPAHATSLPGNKNDLTNDATSSMQPMVDAIAALPGGTTALVATHSTTLYQIFSRLGIDVLSSGVTFPVDLPVGATTCDPVSTDKTNANLNLRGCKVLGFNNLWRVELDRKHGTAQVTDHWVLDTRLHATEHDHAAHGCNQPDDRDENGSAPGR